jgi:hypothetical protein
VEALLAASRDDVIAAHQNGDVAGGADVIALADGAAVGGAAPWSGSISSVPSVSRSSIGAAARTR